MTHIDFVIGFILLMSAVFMVMYFATNSISNNVNEVVANDAKESSLVLEKYFFGFQSNNSLIDTVRETDVLVTERDGAAHSEDVSISLRPGPQARVYDGFWNQISTSIIQTPGQTDLSIQISFNPSEKKRMSIVYFGEESDIGYSSSGNATAVILAGHELNVVSQERLSNLLSRAYDEVRASLDFGHNFRIEMPGFSYGPVPPSKANLFVRSVPVLLEAQDGSIGPALARLSVW
jgi:hypothetical protein